jgi:PAS domain S-box-containing protein
MLKQYTDTQCNEQILKEYKEAVDISSIVSKTDLKGIITFVNNKFCNISGYAENELVGKPHNVVRHPDMPAQAFKDMWETIQSKKPWSGKVKNKKKNGESYYVNTVINPIIDCDGNIVEYIGIRTDVTELEIIKERLIKDLNLSNENFYDAYRTAQAYQYAIDQSNILSRTDINGNITYVNQQFCDISGFTKDELIGKSHSIIKYLDSQKTKRLYKELWQTISSGKTWKGQFENISKDGRIYYVDSTIVPILDKDGKILEYLAIRHDVTNIVTFHKELENTQREIINKMSEIVESRSKETGLHVKRVSEYSKELAILAGLSDEDVNLLYAASPMHDIGKVGIPDSILLKPGPLDDDEWVIMKNHSKAGYDILKNSNRSILKAASIVSYTHHEKWDGSGYPNTLSGDEIHIFGRISAIADVFDALGSDRAYKRAWELEKIIDFFKKERAKHFDPILTDIFLENIDKMVLIRDKYKD